MAELGFKSRQTGSESYPSNATLKAFDAIPKSSVFNLQEMEIWWDFTCYHFHRLSGSLNHLLLSFRIHLFPGWASPVVQWYRTLLPAVQKMQETWVWSVGKETPLEENMATHFSILTCRIPWTEEPGRLYSIGLQRVELRWATRHTFPG